MLHKFKGRSLLADAMGTGKTAQVLLYTKRHPEVNPMIIVCPAGLKWVWANQAQQHFGIRTEILEGVKPFKKRKPPPKEIPTIINYDILWPWMDYLLSIKPKCIIIDECHALLNRDSKRTRAMNLLCQNVPHVIALSGTPLTSRPMELFPTLNILRPDLFPSFYPFAHRFCGAKRNHWGWDFRGASNLDQLHELLSNNLMIRRRKEDVLQELPDKIQSVIHIQLDNQREYDLAHKDFLSWLAKHNPKKVDKASKSEKLTRIGYLKQLVGRLKLPTVIEWIQNFLRASDEKLVVFAYHKHVIEELANKFKSLCVVVNGDITGKKRELAVKKFQTNSSTRLFFGNLIAAGQGITLTASSTVLIAELDYVPGRLLQAEARVHRIGTKNCVNTYYMVAKNTMEIPLLRLLQSKQGNLNTVIDGGIDQGESLDLFDQLCELLEREAKNGSTV